MRIDSEFEIDSALHDPGFELARHSRQLQMHDQRLRARRLVERGPMVEPLGLTGARKRKISELL
jgi:hypothetical protein